MSERRTAPGYPTMIACTAVCVSHVDPPILYYPLTSAGDEPCDHHKSAERKFSGELVTDYDFDYDLACLSDGEYTSAPRPSKTSLDSPFLGLTTRLGSRFNTINRRKSSRKTNLMSSPTTEVSFENVLSRGPSSRSSSVSSPHRHMPERHSELPPLSTPGMSCHDSGDSIGSLYDLDEETHDQGHLSLERERAKAITPLLPPLMTAPLAKPPTDSPLQSPTIAPSSAATEVPQTTTNFSRPSLSTRPSVSSLRQMSTAPDLCFGLPAILQEHDEWSDRLGHANFTITPQPYELEKVDSSSITQFRQDWETARVNYTKHLVRTGENYGQTSKIYGLTEAKWAEIEGKWKAIYEAAVEQAIPATCNAQSYTITARSRSRGRTRGRSGSASAAIMGRPANDDFFAELQWQRIEDGLPSAVPRMLDAEGKFPARGDEDIVGPMHRAETMERSQSEEKHGAKFWKNLAEKVGLRR